MLILAKANPAEYENQLLTFFNEADVNLREEAFPIVTQISGSGSTEALLNLTADREERIRLAAIQALEKRPGDSTLLRLRELCADLSPRVRQLAKRILAERSDKKEESSTAKPPLPK